MNFAASFDLQQKVSSVLSILLIAVLSIAVALFSLHAADDILQFGESSLKTNAENIRKELEGGIPSAESPETFQKKDTSTHQPNRR